MTTYYAPNAALLADERFVATHCFRMAPEDTLADDLVGVRFEPSHRPRYTDVMGTLWLDGVSTLPYHPSHVPLPIRPAAAR